ncbi:helix-turn-helix domain-containing protein [Shewanella woodyi]|uniref:helix-turn-helix domain-containing protein n=1 Tax=Shewanella woodyi TaxID=60961 RepID=UPI003747E339
MKVLIGESKKIDGDYEWSGVDGRLLRLIRDKLIVAIKIPLQLPYPKDSRLLAILTQLQLEPSNRNNLVQWGNIVGASARTLSRLFKNETGLTYSEWRQRFNVQVAITKLSSGETVSNISLNLGYESPSSFIYMFRKLTGVTPGFYSQLG